MVFTANAGLVHGNDAVVASFRHAERQPEAQHFEKFFAARGYRLHPLREGTIFEGAGDALFDSQGRLWFGSGIRSDPHALEEVAAALGVEGDGIDIRGLELVDPRWYHLDTAFCPLPDGQAIAYEKAFSPKSVSALNGAFGENLICISGQDARNFACNAVSIGRSVILHKASTELKFALERRGLAVIETDVSEFLKAGGACKCLTLEI
jgi:N-dimethylarginine dimethylaminohydrolase